ncbi:MULTISPECIES: ECF transporter S component [Clostridiaceae]|uniref:ECF transporter S component n=1 Tax=Clostridiaceae TaxID=31979 RepID=UPI0005519D8C|nr:MULTISPECIES: ECF transporter S component [Clostridiaceae]
MNLESRNNANLSNRKAKTRQLTVVGMLSAISIILGITGYGFIPLPGVKATIMHVPVIIGALIEGPVVGICIGLIFGIFSVFQNMMVPSLLSFAFMNPLVSVLPRVIIPIVAYYTYKAIPIKNKNNPIKIGIGAALGSLTNTVGVLGMMYLLYAAEFAKARSIDASLAGKAIFGIGVANGIPEAIVAVAITIPIVLAVRKIVKHK